MKSTDDVTLYILGRVRLSSEVDMVWRKEMREKEEREYHMRWRITSTNYITYAVFKH